MKHNINIEAENNELILENSHGDIVIIPANKRNWVKNKIKEGCHDCIDSLVDTLPVMDDYAQDGSLFPNGGESGVEQVNKFLKENKDAYYIHLDNGRYEFYGVDKDVLTKNDFEDYYKQDLKRDGNPGYNLIIK